MNITGKKIRALRVEKKLTQAEFVAKCQLCQLDITRSTLAKIESQKRQVIDVELAKFARALGVTVNDLF